MVAVNLKLPKAYYCIITPHYVSWISIIFLFIDLVNIKMFLLITSVGSTGAPPLLDIHSLCLIKRYKVVTDGAPSSLNIIIFKSSSESIPLVGNLKMTKIVFICFI